MNNVIKRIALIAMFGAITGLLYCYVKFPLPIFPSFLDVNFSMIPVIICIFMLGPWDGVVVVLLRFVMKIILVGTSTAYAGEVADLVLGILTALAGGLIYTYYKGKGRSILSFTAIVATWLIVAVLLNIFVNIPLYTNLFFDGNIEPLIGMCNTAFKVITFGNLEATKDNFMVCYVFLAVIPFNLMLALVVVLITAPVHHRLKDLYNMI